MPNLVLLAGIPGTGKSTWAKTFFDLKYKIVSSDAIRQRLAGSLRDAHDKKIKPWDVFYQEIEDALRHDVDVIADATFLTRRHRDRARDVATATGAKCHLVLFKNVFTAQMRNAARDEETKVPSDAMDGMMDLYWNSLAETAQEQYATVTTIEAFN